MSPVEPQQPQFPSNQYNILLVLTDQERYIPDSEIPTSLHRRGLDQLQRRGITFTNHQINSVACSSSRSNLYTGQHITRTGIFDNVNFPYQPDLSPTKIKTMGHWLRESPAHYKTAYKGKWHLTNSFDRPYREGDKSLSLEDYGFSDWHGVTDGIHHALGGHHFDSVTVGSAIQWMRATGRACQDDAGHQPWMLAVNLVNPHDIMFFDTTDDDDDGNTTNHQATKEQQPTIAETKKAPNHSTYRQTHDDIPLPSNWQQALDEEGRPKAHRNYSEIYDVMVGNVPTSGPDGLKRMKRYQDYYYNCIQDMDDNLALLLDQLDATGMAANTIIFYTSDHGELGGAHGMRGKGGCAYKEQNHVPLVVVHPGYDHHAGKRCKAVTSHIDILPTVLAAASASTGNDDDEYESPDLPGHDFTKLLEDPEGAQYDTIRPNGALFTYNMLITVIPPSYVQEAAIQSKQFLGMGGANSTGSSGASSGGAAAVTKETIIDVSGGGSSSKGISIGNPSIGSMISSFWNAASTSTSSSNNSSSNGPNYCRGAIRTVFDGRYKYSRYFFPKRHNTPNSTLAEILQYNDIELFDLETDPHENHNLAGSEESRAEYGDLIEEMNTKMNLLIQKEIGQDKGQMLPFGKTLVNWSVQPKALETI